MESAAGPSAHLKTAGTDRGQIQQQSASFLLNHKHPSVFAESS
jgi:hypothetical protein